MENFYFPEIEKVEKFCRHQKSQRRRHRDDIINRRDMPPKGPPQKEVE